MAKKKAISYGPDAMLIQGARQVADSEALKNTAGGIAFAQEFTGAIKLGLQEQEKSKAIVDAYASQIQTPENITLLDEKNQPSILEFVRKTRGNVVELSKAYAKTKDVNILDDIQMEKAKIVNLKNQIDGYTNEAKLYVSADKKNQIARGKSFNYKQHDLIWTKNGQLSIESNGDIGFNTELGYNKYNDVSNAWNVNNNTWGTTLMSLDGKIVNNARKGGKFDKAGVYNNTLERFKLMGPEEVQVAVEQDITGDAYEDLSFQAIWGSGKMKPEFYEGLEEYAIYGKDNKVVGFNTDWMFDNNNTSTVTRLMSSYTTNVLEDRHNNNYADPNQRRQSKPANYIVGGQTFNARDWNNSFVPFIRKLQKPSKGETFVSPTGVKLKYEKGKYYKMTGVNEYDMDNPMTFKDVAVLDGWANYLTDNTEKSTTGGGAADSL